MHPIKIHNVVKLNNIGIIQTFLLLFIIHNFRALYTGPMWAPLSSDMRIWNLYAHYVGMLAGYVFSALNIPRESAWCLWYGIHQVLTNKSEALLRKRCSNCLYDHAVKAAGQLLLGLSSNTLNMSLWPRILWPTTQTHLKYNLSLDIWSSSFVTNILSSHWMRLIILCDHIRNSMSFLLQFSIIYRHQDYRFEDWSLL